MKAPAVVFHNKILLSVHTQNLTHTVKYVMRCKPNLLTNRNSSLNYDTSLLQPPCNHYYFSRPVTIPPHSKGFYTEIEQDLTLSTQGLQIQCKFSRPTLNGLCLQLFESGRTAEKSEFRCQADPFRLSPEARNPQWATFIQGRAPASASIGCGIRTLISHRNS